MADSRRIQTQKKEREAFERLILLLVCPLRPKSVPFKCARVVIMEKRRFVIEFDVVKVMFKRYSNDRVVDVKISSLFRPIPHTWRHQPVTKKKTQPNQIIKSQDKSFFSEYKEKKKAPQRRWCNSWF